MSLIQRIDALLPQTQCGKCGHPGCKPYAEGIASGEPINKCPPGGSETIAALAELLKVPVLELDVSRGSAPAQIAYIREAECIGCTKCIQACPVDAILGAAGQMHTVIAQECTGCEWCIPVCPMDCITLQSTRGTLQTYPAGLAQCRHEARLGRLEREQQEQETRRRKTSLKALPTTGREQLQAEIAAAVARAKAKKQLQ